MRHLLCCCLVLASSTSLAEPARWCGVGLQGSLSVPAPGEGVPRDFVALAWMQPNDLVTLDGRLEARWVHDNGEEVDVRIESDAGRASITADDLLTPGVVTLMGVDDDGGATIDLDLRSITVEDRLAQTPPVPDVNGAMLRDVSADWPGCGDVVEVHLPNLDDDNVGWRVWKDADDGNDTDSEGRVSVYRGALLLEPDPSRRDIVVGAVSEAGVFSGWSDPIDVETAASTCRCTTSTDASWGGVGLCGVFTLAWCFRRRFT